MPATEQSDFVANPFELISVDETKTPAGMEGDKWCKYIIKQGDNEIVGYSVGSARKVKKEAKEKVEELNLRRYGKKGPPKPVKAKVKAA
ncbi:MAG: hypothetical protein P8R04_02595 [Gammaproteobacteria bacterium]|nr:hypothetical protein [Gammaproteobacteria bacterium]